MESGNRRNHDFSGQPQYATGESLGPVHSGINGLSHAERTPTTPLNHTLSIVESPLAATVPLPPVSAVLLDNGYTTPNGDTRQILRDRGVPEEVLGLLNEKGVLSGYVAKVTKLGETAGSIREDDTSVMQDVGEVISYEDYVEDRIREHLQGRGLEDDALEDEADRVLEHLLGPDVPVGEVRDAVRPLSSLIGEEEPTKLQVVGTINGVTTKIRTMFSENAQGEEGGSIVADTQEISSGERVHVVLHERVPHPDTEKRIQRDPSVRHINARADLAHHIVAAQGGDVTDPTALNHADNVARGQLPSSLYATAGGEQLFEPNVRASGVTRRTEVVRRDLGRDIIDLKEGQQ